jgi:hypothetical protein
MKIYITFGQAHIHQIDEKIFNKDSVAEIECVSASDGRQKAVELFGVKFAFQYSEKDITPEFMKFFPRGIIEIN